MHGALEQIRDAIKGTKFEGDVFLVGGAVRDELLGFSGSDDFDLVTENNALELAQVLFDMGVSTMHPVTYERFGTAMIEVAGVKVELVTARSESYDPDSRKPIVETSSYLQDSLRRDFTVNTLMRSLDSWELVDTLGTGRSDLCSKILRTPKDPEVTFEDDPLRMLRAVRFKHKLGFELEPRIAEAIRYKRERLKIISEERIREEFIKMLLHPTASEALKDLMDLGLLEQFMPEFLPGVGCDQGSYHHLDVWDHTRLVVHHIHQFSTEPDEITLLGGLFHDVAKPETKHVSESGKVTFYSHDQLGQQKSREIMLRLTFSLETANRASRLVRHHMRIGSAEEFSDTAARRLIRDLDEDLDRLLMVVEADCSSLKPGVRKLDLGEIREAVSRVKAATPINSLKSPLSGEEIMEMTGLSAGREIGQIKSRLEEAVLNGELLPDDKERARHLVLESHPI